MAKVLIGIVTYGKQRYCLDEFQQCLERQTVKADHLFVVNNGESAYATLLRSRKLNAVEDSKPASTRIEKIVNGRNYLRDYALKNNYDYLLMLDSDVMLPNNALEILLSARVDVITGVYLNAFKMSDKTIIAPVVFKDSGNGECQLFTYEYVDAPKVFDVGAAGLGCTLISKRVLEQIQFHSFGNSTTGGEDMAFYVDARAKGFRTVGTSFVKCTHRPYPIDDKRAKFFEWKHRVPDWTVTIKPQ